MNQSEDQEQIKATPKETQEENNDLSKALENDSKKEKPLLNAENAENNDSTIEEEDGENKSDLENEIPTEPTDFEKMLEDWDDDLEDLDLDNIDLEEEDPFLDYQDGGHQSDEEPPSEPPKEDIKEIKERVSSEQNRKNLTRLGLKLVDKADLFKANLCSFISSKHVAEYVADDEMKEIVLECIKEYLATKEVEELSPFGALMAALAMWTLPPLGVAVLDRFQVQKEAKKALNKKTSKTLNSTTEPNSQETKQDDYSQLKEYQQKRKVFSCNASGLYNRTPDGKTYISVELADELPSPQIQEWIDEGKKDREIRKLLGHGK